MHADQVAVGGQPDVALEPLRAGVERRHVGPQGVLGVLVAGAAVRDHLRASCVDSLAPAAASRARGRAVAGADALRSDGWSDGPTEAVTIADMSPVPQHDPGERSDGPARKTYLYLRAGTSVSLAIFLAAFARHRAWPGGDSTWLGSISAYYYTPVRSLFVGTPGRDGRVPGRDQGPRRPREDLAAQPGPGMCAPVRGAGARPPLEDERPRCGRRRTLRARRVRRPVVENNVEALLGGRRRGGCCSPHSPSPRPTSTARPARPSRVRRPAASRFAAGFAAERRLVPRLRPLRHRRSPMFGLIVRRDAWSTPPSAERLRRQPAARRGLGEAGDDEASTGGSLR